MLFTRINARARHAAMTLAAAVAAPVITAGVCEAARVSFPASSGGTGNAYEVFVDTAINHDDARDAASAAGGHLVTITSSAEQSFVESLLSGANSPTGSYWLGFDRAGSSNAFTWETGEAFGFENFAPTETNNFQGIEDAGQIYWSRVPGDDVANRKGTWNDAPVTGFPADVDIPDLRRAGYIVEIEGAGGNPGGGSNNGGTGGNGTGNGNGNGTGNGTGNGNGDGDGDGGVGGNGDGGGDGGVNAGGGSGGGDGGPVAIPLPPALFAAPLGALVAGLAARRRRVN
jgi:hypothetical protein